MMHGTYYTTVTYEIAGSYCGHAVLFSVVKVQLQILFYQGFTVGSVGVNVSQDMLFIRQYKTPLRDKGRQITCLNEDLLHE